MMLLSSLLMVSKTMNIGCISSMFAQSAVSMALVRSLHLMGTSSWRPHLISPPICLMGILPWTQSNFAPLDTLVKVSNLLYTTSNLDSLLMMSQSPISHGRILSHTLGSVLGGPPGLGRCYPTWWGGGAGGDHCSAIDVIWDAKSTLFGPSPLSIISRMCSISLKGGRICGGCTGLEDGVVPLFDMVEVSAPSHLFTRCYECCSCFIDSLFTTSYYGGSTSGVGSDVVVGKNVSLYNSELCPHSCPGVLDYCSLLLSGEGVVWEGSSGLLVGMEGYFSAVLVRPRPV